MANATQPTPGQSAPYRDAVERLSAIRQALALADYFGGGPAPDLEARSGQMVSAAAAGLEALAAVAPHDGASRDLVERIRRELAEISNLAIR